MTNGSKYAPVAGKIPGRALNLGGVEFTLPPLNLDGVQAFEPLQKRVAEVRADGAGLPELFGVVADALMLSLGRNYPDLTREEVLALLDLGNFLPAMDALAEVSGYRKAAAGESMPASP